jgi:hypothetical protein
MPSDFPIPSCWPVKGKEYHVVNIKFVTLSKCLGYQLSEISLENCYPYAFFDSKRFSIAQEDLEALLALMKDCKTSKEQRIEMSSIFKPLLFLLQEMLSKNCH